MKAVQKWSVGLTTVTLLLVATAFGWRAGNPTFANHVVEVLADGSIRCHDEVLCPDASRTRVLLEHLRKIALTMPFEPVWPGVPGGPQFPSGQLDLHVDTKAKCDALVLATDCLGMIGIRIWNLRLVPKTNGLASAPMSFHLSKNVGLSCGRDWDTYPILLHISSEDAALASDSVRLGYVVSNPTGWAHAGSGQLAYDNEEAQDLDSLRQILLELHVKRPECAVELQTPADLPFARALETVRVARRAGMTEIWAAGGAFVY